MQREDANRIVRAGAAVKNGRAARNIYRTTSYQPNVVLGV